jgi:diguanylate cyclase (GGDEF)-like protein
MSFQLDLPLQCQLPLNLENTKIQRYVLAMESLLLVVQDLSKARSLQQIMTTVLMAARKITDSDGSSFVLKVNGDCYYADENAIAPLWKGQRFSMDMCICGWAIANRQPAIINDVYSDERIPYALYKSTFVQSMVIMPIRMINPIGCIGIYWAKQHHPTKEELKLLHFLADHTAVAMENLQQYLELEEQLSDRTAALEKEISDRALVEAQVCRLALMDELTGLYNRRGFFLLAERKIQLAHKSHIPATLLFIDLDGLKTINDIFGHEIGDRAIVAIARLLKQTCRHSDMLARLGGDEFVVLLQGEDCGCEVIQQRLQVAIDQFNQTQQQPFHLSASIGAHSYNPHQPVSLDELVTLADIQMYQRKRAKKVNS